MDTLFGGRQTIDGRAGRSACALPSSPGEPCVAQLVHLFMTLSILMDVLGMYPIWKTARASTGRLPPHSNMSHSSSFPRPFVPFKGTSTNCGISCRWTPRSSRTRLCGSPRGVSRQTRPRCLHATLQGSSAHWRSLDDTCRKPHQDATGALPRWTNYCWTHNCKQWVSPESAGKPAFPRLPPSEDSGYRHQQPSSLTWPASGKPAFCHDSLSHIPRWRVAKIGIWLGCRWCPSYSARTRPRALLPGYLDLAEQPCSVGQRRLSPLAPWMWTVRRHRELSGLGPFRWTARPLIWKWGFERGYDLEISSLKLATTPGSFSESR